jgi:plasmid stabilization system protein ParE
MHNIRYSNQAQLDINEAIEHIASQSVQNALEYLRRYEEKIELLSLNPHMGIECKNKRIKRDCRVLVHASHIVIYKILDDTKEIYLIRIFHGSADYANELNQENAK